MSDIAIRVDGLSKQYRIGGKQERYRTLRDTLTDAFVSPFRRARELLRGQAYGAAELDETIWALRDVSLEIKQGEVVGIIGPNGAGKTTLLKILSRITEPTEGQAEIRGRVGSLLEVGTGFHPELTGRENIFLNGAILGMKKVEIDHKFEEIVGFAEIEKFIDTPVKHYSSGMYVRLAFGVAAHLEPEILLVDEVLAVGDTAFQKKCLGKMGNVAKEGRTVLFVSHNMAAVNKLCSKCVLLRTGEVAALGETSSVVRKYLDGLVGITSDERFKPTGSSAVEFSRVWISTCDGTLASELDVKEPFLINLAFDVQTSVRNVDISVRIKTQGDFSVCLASLSDTNSGDIVPLEKGRYICSFEVPALFLVPNIYRVSAIAHVPNQKNVDYYPDIVSLTVVETGSSMQRYSKPWSYGCVLANFPTKLAKGQ